MAKIIQMRFRRRAVAGGTCNALPRSAVSAGSLPPNRLLDTGETCRCLKISRPTLLKYISAGKIRARKIGRGWKISETDLLRFLSGE